MKINWSEYLSAILPNEFIPKNGIDSLIIYVRELKILVQLEELLQELSPEILSDIMDWDIILNYVNLLDQRFLDADFVGKNLKKNINI